MAGWRWWAAMVGGDGDYRLALGCWPRRAPAADGFEPEVTAVDDRAFLELAIEQARIGLAEGGIPIGAVLVVDGAVLGAGRNRRVQAGSAIHHGEMNALELAGRQSAATYARATMYTTLSPCPMCSGAMLLYGIRRVVIGENHTLLGSEALLRSHGVEVTVLDLPECKQLMDLFIREQPTVWDEDIGVTGADGA
ncbi:MAG: Cytosine deaminase [Ilumatobacteraceae bacterium]|nr:Cytosine deaminase [Ilumatobacteraceae bacterium]